MSAISWFAIPVTDLARARKFYCEIFGFDKMEDMPTPNGTCAIFPSEEGGIAGSLNPFMGFKPTADSGITVWLNAGNDLQVVLDKIVPAGGSIMMEKTPIGNDFGFMAMMIDIEGNRVGLHSSQ